MKADLKTLFAIIISGTVLLGACDSNKKNSSTASTGTEEGHNHTFSCPMHPEVTGKEGDMCPKCGMKLEHNDHAGAANSTVYFMDFNTNPRDVAPGQEVTLSMIPKIKGKETEQVPLK